VTWTAPAIALLATLPLAQIAAPDAIPPWAVQVGGAVLLSVVVFLMRRSLDALDAKLDAHDERLKTHNDAIADLRTRVAVLESHRQP
jgi:hypothetical protein